MQLQYGCHINDMWIPKGEETGLKDISNQELKTGDWVSLTGCRQTKAVIGKNSKEGYTLFFGSENGSVQWDLTKETIINHNIKKFREEGIG